MARYHVPLSSSRPPPLYFLIYTYGGCWGMTDVKRGVETIKSILLYLIIPLGKKSFFAIHVYDDRP
jgi:hypothetical protein